jgi:hypothetical protein
MIKHPFVLEHRYRAFTDEGVLEGTTVHRDPDWPHARAKMAMTVCAIVVRGSPKNVRVLLGDEEIKVAGTMKLDPPRELSKGDDIAIDFDGNGGVELVAERDTVFRPKV